MKVIGAGFGRTGTSSVKVALELLGFGPCYHMSEVFEHPHHIPTWQAAADGQPVDWKAILAEFNAAVDWPACNYYQELMAVYPDAKVLLTVRDPEKWYESVMNTIYFTNSVETDDPDYRIRYRMINNTVWRNVFDDRFEDKAYALSVFNHHTEDVKKQVPADRLLVLDVKEGWEPLCRFLDVPVPTDTPFPRLNDTASFQQGRSNPPRSASPS